VHEAAHVRVDRGVENVASAVDRDALELVPGAPVADLGGGVVNDVNAVARRVQRLRLGDVTLDELDVLCLEPTM
jgi:hypothetical protein